MVVVVTLEDGSKWLTDVGFGGQVPRRPLRIDQLDLNPQADTQTYGAVHVKSEGRGRGAVGGGGVVAALLDDLKKTRACMCVHLMYVSWKDARLHR